MTPALQAEALFASDLQPSQFPNGSAVRCTINDTVASLGEQRCGEVLAQAYGEHPEAAAERMAWAVWTVSWAYATAGVS
jgi:hypothetical protein